MANYRLLQLLPGDVRVMDCAECGRLTTSCWAAFREHGKLGLRILGRWKAERDHRRPLCKTCSGPRERPLPGPGEHRPEGQAVPIWRQLGGL